MIVTKYTVTPEKGDWADAHFELRIDDNDRPFHIVLRPQGDQIGQIGLNSMASGTWGDERTLPLPVPLDELRMLIIEVVNDTVHILVGSEILTFPMPVSQMDVTLAAATKNMSWRMESGDALVPVLHMARLENSGETAQVKIGGRILDLPGTRSQRAHTALLQATMGSDSTYVQFAASRPLTRPGETLTILDIDTSPIHALWAAILFPKARICRLSQGGEADDFLTGIARANDLTGIRILSQTEIGRTLTTAEGPVLLQGGGAFDTFGAAIDALPAARRAKLSIWTTADDIVPGHRVFPCANAQIRVPPAWALNHSGAVDLSGRRPGLDIAVAAYNAKDYLIECVTSLLCKGRDDVRVIIVDDGSSDGSGEMADAHFAADPRVRVERKPNGGCASARNYGRLVSDATHVTFVDADDFVSDGFFADLYDLALYSGCEVTRAGFDFYDESRPEPYYPSYEEEQFKDHPRISFNGQSVIRLQAQDIIKGQPSIWRKVYRRDFLDAKNIYFPENVRAYDDYIFQMFALTAARDILMLPEHKYHYRQHPAQDIRQGDERHFYMLYMFQMLLKRSVDEGWTNFAPYAESVIDSISWSSDILRPDLVDSFLRASARFCVGVTKTYGPALIEDLVGRVGHPDFAYHYKTELAKADGLWDGAFWSYFNGELYHPDVLHMRQAMHKAR